MTGKKTNWSKTAKKQYSAAIEYILNDSIKNAETVERKFREKLKTVSKFPETCPPDKYKVDNDGSYRVFILYHYRVSYRVKTNEIIILRIRHTSMKPKYY